MPPPKSIESDLSAPQKVILERLRGSRILTKWAALEQNFELASRMEPKISGAGQINYP
jgi:hypothetical protein